MKIQCNACEAAEATVLCCADEAALCWVCDAKIHAANKLASKHQRVPLSSSSSQMPKCDICQETTGYFFCLEDRALLCRKCDIAIHTANPYVSAHKRFLLTGVRVGLEPTEPVDSISKAQTNSMEKTIDSASKARTTSMERTTETTFRTSPKNGISLVLSAGKNKETSGNQPSGSRVLPNSRVPYSGSTMAGTLVDWPLEEFLGLADFSQNYGLMEQGSSKADTANHGDSDWSPIYRAAFDEDLDIDECLGQVPQISPAKVPSPPTASGLHWPKNSRSSFLADNVVFVPDVVPLPPSGDVYQFPQNPADVSLKRRRIS